MDGTANQIGLHCKADWATLQSKLSSTTKQVSITAKESGM